MKALLTLSCLLMVGVAIPQGSPVKQDNEAAAAYDSIVYNVRKMDSNVHEIRLNEAIQQHRDSAVLINTNSIPQRNL